MIEHRVEHELRLLVTLFDTTDHLLHVVGAQQGIETCLSCDAFEQLFLCVLPTVAEADEVGSRQTACPFW